MKLEQLDRKGIDEFIEELNSRTDFVKYQFYNMAYRENELMIKEQEITERYDRKNISNVTIVSEDIAIIKYGYEPHDKIYYMACVKGELVRDTATYTFDEALLLALMKKYNNSKGFMFVAKALGMQIGTEVQY